MRVQAEPGSAALARLKRAADEGRAAWERALEEVAFAQVIMRHRDQIKPATLSKVSVLTEQDCQLWTTSYAKCCSQMAGHHQSRSRNRAIIVLTEWDASPTNMISSRAGGLPMARERVTLLGC